MACELTFFVNILAAKMNDSNDDRFLNLACHFYEERVTIGRLLRHVGV